MGKIIDLQKIKDEKIKEEEARIYGQVVGRIKHLLPKEKPEKPEPPEAS